MTQANSAQPNYDEGHVANNAWIEIGGNPAQAGLWHFEIKEEYKYRFTDEEKFQGRNRPTIYTSKAKNFDCVLHLTLKAIVEYVLKSDITTNYQTIINHFRMNHVCGVDQPLNVTDVREFGKWFVSHSENYLNEQQVNKVNEIRYIKPLFQTPDNFSSGNNAKYTKLCDLYIPVFIYEFHSFLFRPSERNVNILKEGLKVLPIADTPNTKRIERNLVKLYQAADETELKFEPKTGIEEKILLLFDIETIPLEVREVEKKFKLSYESYNDEVKVMVPTSIQYQFVKVIIDYNEQKSKFFKLSKVITDEVKKDREDEIIDPLFLNIAKVYNKYYLNRNHHLIMIAHNGAKFDIPILAPLFKRYMQLTNLMGADKNNPEYKYRVSFIKQLKTKKKRVEFDIRVLTRDSRMYIDKGSLDSLGETFNVDPKYRKYSLPDNQKDAWFEKYTESQKAKLYNTEFDNQRFPVNIPGETFTEQFKNYGENDVAVLREIVIAHELAIHNNAPNNLIRQSTIGKISSASLAAKPLKEMLTGIKVLNSPLIGKIGRESCIGGVSNVFSPGFINKPKFSKLTDNEIETLFRKKNWKKAKEFRNSSLKRNLTNPQKHKVVLTDAVALYPSVMYKFPYPTHCTGVSDIDYWQTTFKRIRNSQSFKEYQEQAKSSKQALLKVTLIYSKGALNSIPHKHNGKGSLLYKHYNVRNRYIHTGYYNTIDLLNFAYTNKGLFKIHEGIDFHCEQHVFKEMKFLFDMRIDIKMQMKDSSLSEHEFKLLDAKQAAIKTIINSVYGKLLQRSFDEILTRNSRLNSIWTGYIEYGQQILNSYFTTDKTPSLSIIGSFVLAYSKFYIKSVQASLGWDGTDEYNNLVNENVDFFGGDTDSIICYEDDYLLAKKRLKFPGENVLGGFHSDIEIKGHDEVNGMPEIIAARWLVKKTYFLITRGTDKHGNHIYSTKIQGKGLLDKWRKHFDLFDYDEISKSENRSIEANENDDLNHSKFKVDKVTGTVHKQHFDRSFPFHEMLGKERKYTAAIAKETDIFKNSLPVYLPSL